MATNTDKFSGVHSNPDTLGYGNDASLQQLLGNYVGNTSDFYSWAIGQRARDAGGTPLSLGYIPDTALMDPNAANKFLTDEVAYLQRNRDVYDAVNAGQFGSGYQHYTQFGQNDGRQWGNFDAGPEPFIIDAGGKPTGNVVGPVGAVPVAPLTSDQVAAQNKTADDLVAASLASSNEFYSANPNIIKPGEEGYRHGYLTDRNNPLPADYYPEGRVPGSTTGGTGSSTPTGSGTGAPGTGAPSATGTDEATTNKLSDVIAKRHQKPQGRF